MHREEGAETVVEPLMHCDEGAEAEDKVVEHLPKFRSSGKSAV
jgi:hypothetical protein